MARPSREYVLALLLAAFAVPGVRASVVTSMGTGALVDLSTVIVVGEVDSVVAGPDDSGSLSTWVTLRVEESLRGAGGHGQITLRVGGGAWRGWITRVHGAPTFERGERVLVFARPAGNHLSVTGLFQGKYRIEGESGSERAVPDAGEGAVVARRSDEPVQPSDHALGELLADIRRRVLVDAGPAPGRPVQAGAIPPSAEPVPAFTLLNPVVPLRWFEPDSGAPVSVMFNADGAPVAAPDAVAGFEAALGHWTDVTGAAIVLSPGGDTGQACRVFQDGSVVSHGDPCDQVPAFDPNSCSGVLAITGVSGFTLQTRTVNAVTFLRMTEADIVFNADTECFYAGADAASNYEEVLSHELGHVTGLGHSCGDSFSPACTPGTELDDALMRAFAHGGGRGGAPRADDVDGLRFLYPPRGFVDLSLNDEVFSPGETLTLTAELNGTATIDFYLALVLPGGGFVSIAPGFPFNTLVPASAGVPLGFAPDLTLYTYEFTGAEADGTYAWVALLVRAGANPSLPGSVLEFDQVSFDVGP